MRKTILALYPIPPLIRCAAAVYYRRRSWPCEAIRAVAFDMLVKPDAGGSLGQHARKRGLADLKRIAPQVVAVQLGQVEGVEDLSSGRLRVDAVFLAIGGAIGAVGHD